MTTPARMSAKKKLAAALVGAWICHRWSIRYADGQVTRPFGLRPHGFILYTADGFMSATIMAAGRKAFRAKNPRDASEAERAHAFAGYFSYAGRWRLSRGRIEHEVLAALNPGLVGTSQWREVRLEGSRLTLAAVEKTATGLRRHEIEWRRPARR
jgi:hypothetical protein